MKFVISCGELLFIILDLVELENQAAENKTKQLVNCLHISGFNKKYLIENWISFVNNGASVLFAKKKWSFKTLER